MSGSSENRSQDGSQENQLSSLIDEIQDEQEEEEPYTALTQEDIPSVLDSLEAQDSEKWNDGLNKLNGTISQQAEFVEENISIFDLPRLIKVAKANSDETLRVSILEIICRISDISNATKEAVVPLIPDLIPFLEDGHTLDIHGLSTLFEELVTEIPSCSNAVLSGFKSLYDREYVERESATEEVLKSLAQAFELSLLYSRENLNKLFTQAGAVDAMLILALQKRFSKVRLAAQSCLVQVFANVAEIHEHIPIEEDRDKIPIYILNAMFNLLQDEDEEVAKEAMSFIGEDRGEQNIIVQILATENKEILASVILKIADKKPNHVGTPAEWLLIRLTENEESKATVREVFSDVWKNEDISDEKKFRLVGGLIDSFVDLRKCALDGGLVDYMLEKCQSSEKENAVRALTLMDRLMDGEQVTGSVVLRTPGLMEKILDIFDGPSSPSSVHALASSLLVCVIESWNYEEERMRSEAVKYLTQPNVYPRILAGAHSSDLTFADAAFKLLGALIFGEDGGEAFNADEDGPSPTPTKDFVVTGEIVARSVQIIKENPDSTHTKGTLYFLCMTCWGYKRGAELVTKEFERVLPNVDVFFFKSLDGDLDFVSSRIKWRLAEAAVQAGGVKRMEELLSLVQPTDNVEKLRAAVEGFRALLCADGMDMDVGRKNPHLPKLVQQLLNDRTLESMKIAGFMVRLLSYDDKADGYPTWKEEVATEEMANNLGYWLTRPPQEVGIPKPVQAEMEFEEYMDARRKYDDVEGKIREEEKVQLSLVSELLKNWAEHLTPFGPQLVVPLLRATNTDSPNNSLSELLQSFAANKGMAPALVPAIRDILGSESPPDLDVITAWIARGPELADAFYLAGVTANFEKEYERPEGEDQEEWKYTSHQALSTYSYLVQMIEDKDHKAIVQKSFFDFRPALDQAVGFLRNYEEEVHDAFQAGGDLFNLADGYSDGLKKLEEEEGLFDILLKLYDHSELDPPKNVAPLVGKLCKTQENVDQLTALVKSHILGLEPPLEEGAGIGGKGKSKKKKKKRFEPRISTSLVLDRLIGLVNASPEGRKAVKDAGGIELAAKAVSTAEEESDRATALKILQAFVKASEESEDIIDNVKAIIPPIVSLMSKDWTPLGEVANLGRALVDVPGGKGAQVMMDTDLHRALWTFYTNYPTAGDDMAVIIDLIRDFGESEIGRPELLKLMQEILVSEDALVSEEDWGVSHSMRRLLAEGEGPSKLVGEAGAVDYAVRLLKEDDSHLNAIGGALAATLYRNEFIDVQSIMTELGIPSLIEAILPKCTELSTRAYQADDGDEDEWEYKQGHAKTWVQSLRVSLRVVNGEEVEDYEENYFL